MGVSGSIIICIIPRLQDIGLEKYTAVAVPELGVTRGGEGVNKIPDLLNVPYIFVGVCGCIVLCYFIIVCSIVYSYFMPVCSIVKTITPRCRGRPDARGRRPSAPCCPTLLVKYLAANGVAVDDAVLLQNRKFHQICSISV